LSDADNLSCRVFFPSLRCFFQSFYDVIDEWLPFLEKKFCHQVSITTRYLFAKFDVNSLFQSRIRYRLHRALFFHFQAVNLTITPIWALSALFSKFQLDGLNRPKKISKVSEAQDLCVKTAHTEQTFL